MITTLLAKRVGLEMSQISRLDSTCSEDNRVRIAKCRDFSPILGNSLAVVEDSIPSITLVNSVALQVLTGTAYAAKYC
jgi:hypothetical protein